MAALHMYFSGADGKLFSVPLRQVSHPEQVQAADFTGPVLSAVSSFLLSACLLLVYETLEYKNFSSQILFFSLDWFHQFPMIL